MIRTLRKNKVKINHDDVNYGWGSFLQDCTWGCCKKPTEKKTFFSRNIYGLEWWKRVSNLFCFTF